MNPQTFQLFIRRFSLPQKGGRALPQHPRQPGPVRRALFHRCAHTEAEAIDWFVPWSYNQAPGRAVHRLLAYVWTLHQPLHLQHHRKQPKGVVPIFIATVSGIHFWILYRSIPRSSAPLQIHYDRHRDRCTERHHPDGYASGIFQTTIWRHSGRHACYHRTFYTTTPCLCLCWTLNL